MTSSVGVGAIETRGIEAVPEEERHGKARELFWMWFGANMGVLGITLGAARVVAGLNFPQVLLVAIGGSVGSFLLVGFLSLAGKRGGAPGLTLSRAVFGIRGNGGPTVVSWLGFVGWETIMCTTAAFALLALARLAGIEPTAGLTIVAVLICVAIAALIGLFGHATIMWVQRWLTWVFGLFTGIVVVFLIGHVDWAAVWNLPGGEVGSVIAGIGIIASGTGLGWLAAGADYARYLPSAVRTRNIMVATIAGAGIPLVVLIGMGGLMAASKPELASANDPVAAIGAALPSWMAVPYLLTAVAGLIAAADLSMYSSGLNLLTAGIRIPRVAAVGVDAVLITVGGIYITVIAEDFYGPFQAFLMLMAVPLVVWGAIFAVDMLSRPSYDGAELNNTKRGGKYWYTGGFRLSACIAWVAGIVVGYLFTVAGPEDQPWFTGPLSHTVLGTNGLGWIVGALVGAVGYPLLRKVFDRS